MRRLRVSLASWSRISSSCNGPSPGSRKYTRTCMVAGVLAGDLDAGDELHAELGGPGPGRGDAVLAVVIGERHRRAADLVGQRRGSGRDRPSRQTRWSGCAGRSPPQGTGARAGRVRPRRPIGPNPAWSTVSRAGRATLAG